MRFSDLPVGAYFQFYTGGTSTPQTYRKIHLSNGPDRWDQCWYSDLSGFCYYGNSLDARVHQV